MTLKDQSIHKMTEQEYKQGWIELVCGHAYVFRSTVKYDPAGVEYCDHEGYRFPAVKINSIIKCSPSF